MSRRLLLFSIVSLFFTAGGIAQSKSEKLYELHDDGNFFFDREDFEEAVYYYKQLYSFDTANANVAFKIGSCYLKIPGKETLAIPFLEQASQHISFEYDVKSLEERDAPLHSLFYLGNVYRMNDEIDKALKAYTLFTESPFYEGNYNVTIVENEIIATERAKVIIDMPIDVSIEPITDTRINTTAIERNPVMSGDGKHLVFIRRLKFYDAIFYCQRVTDSTWSEPRNINGEILSDGNHYPTGFSFDGSTLLLIEEKDFNKDIYYTTRKIGRWQPLKALEKPINSRANEDYASFSDDGQKLLFASDRWGGEGGLDLYVAELNENNEWDKPYNLGNLINSPFNESAGYFTNEDKSILFSSQGHHKMGGYDVFYTNLKNGAWSAPFNVGYPVNTTSNNFHYQPIDGGKKILFSRFDLETGNEDIVICIFNTLPSFVYIKLPGSDNWQADK